MATMYAHLLTLVEDFVKARLSNEPTGHDWWHAERVRHIARRLHRTEGGDWHVIAKPEDDHSITESFLKQSGASPLLIKDVMHIITTMSFSKSFDTPVAISSIERQIVQDADRLDALGAIGIARAFTFGGRMSRPMYDPSYISKTLTSSKEYKLLQGSTLHHFDEKLLLLIELLNTKTAKEIAKERDEYMRLFVDRFKAEWDGLL